MTSIYHKQTCIKMILKLLKALKTEYSYRKKMKSPLWVALNVIKICHTYLELFKSINARKVYGLSHFFSSLQSLQLLYEIPSSSKFKGFFYVHTPSDYKNVHLTSPMLFGRANIDKYMHVFKVRKKVKCKL